MPFFGVPGGLLDAAGKFGGMVGKGLFNAGKSVGEELLKEAKPIVMNEVSNLRDAARGFIREEGGALARKGIEQLRSSAHGFVTGANVATHLGANDITAFTDKARSRLGEALLGSKERVHQLSSKLIDSGADELQRAARAAERVMGNATAENAEMPLGNDRMRNDRMLPNDRAAMRREMRNKHRYENRKVNRRHRYRN